MKAMKMILFFLCGEAVRFRVAIAVGVGGGRLKVDQGTTNNAHQKSLQKVQRRIEKINHQNLLPL
jgi:hypothetical protein